MGLPLVCCRAEKSRASVKSAKEEAAELRARTLVAVRPSHLTSHSTILMDYVLCYLS